jgi:hypothetical protein
MATRMYDTMPDEETQRLIKARGDTIQLTSDQQPGSAPVSAPGGGYYASQDPWAAGVWGDMTQGQAQFTPPGYGEWSDPTGEYDAVMGRLGARTGAPHSAEDVNRAVEFAGQRNQYNTNANASLNYANAMESWRLNNAQRAGIGMQALPQPEMPAGVGEWRQSRQPPAASDQAVVEYTLADAPRFRAPGSAVQSGIPGQGGSPGSSWSRLQRELDVQSGIPGRNASPTDRPGPNSYEGQGSMGYGGGYGGGREGIDLESRYNTARFAPWNQSNPSYGQRDSIPDAPAAPVQPGSRWGGGAGIQRTFGQSQEPGQTPPMRPSGFGMPRYGQQRPRPRAMSPMSSTMPRYSSYRSSRFGGY